MKIKKLKLISYISVIAIFFSIIFSYTNIIKANGTDVSSIQELKEAIAQNESVNLTQSLTITEEITIPNTYNGIIKGNGHTLILGSIVENMFVSNGATVEFQNITLDGDNKGRLVKVNGGTLSFNASKLTKGTTQNFQPKIQENVNKQNYQGGAIFIDAGATVNLIDSTFESNHTKIDTPEDAATPDGGAIYSGGRSTINVIGGKFIGNNSGGPTALGGAIMLEGGSTININTEADTQKDKTIFEGNHSISIGQNNHGGNIQVKNSTANIYATTFKIAKPFEVGGAIHFHGATGNIKNSEFIIDSLGDAYAISGGAIASLNSNLVINASKFTAIGHSKVSFAGGFIDIVEGGSFHLLNSVLTGRGQGNGNELASFGGAISFETGSSAKAWIDNTIFQNFSTSDTGGTISIGTRKGEERYDYGNGNYGLYSNQSVTITNSRIENTQTLWWGRQPGGAIYVGPRNSALIYNTSISNAKAGVGGAIYNMGTVTLDGGSSINGSYAMYAGASIFNDGRFILGNASVNASFTGDAHWNGNYTKYKDPVEYPGINIYAKKDIIVTPNATLNDKDIKVFDGTSSVVLTDELNKRLNVSISELEGKNNTDIELFESNHRYVGYTVARGIKASDLDNMPVAYYPGEGDVRYIPENLSNNYKLKATDAQFIHYVTKRTTDTDDKVAEYNDHTSLAKWDYVLNPEDNIIVLGQRAKMVYHTNEANAAIEGGNDENNDIGEKIGQKLDQIYTIYKSGGGKAKVSVDNIPVTELTPVDKIPLLENYVFRSWNTNAVIGKPRFDMDKTEALYNFTAPENTFTRGTTNEITSILSPDTENTLHTYAIYDKLLVVKAKKTWNSTNKGEVTLQLVRTDKNNKVVEEKTVGEDTTDWVQFNGVPKTENGVDITSNYKVIEKDTTNGIVTIGNNKYKVEEKEVTDDTTLVPNKENNTKYFVVKNTELIDIPVKKVWAGEENVTHDEDVVVELYNGDDKVEGKTLTLTSTVVDGKTYEGKFENLEKLNEQGTDITYTVKEKSVNGTEVVTSDNKEIVTIGNKKYTVTVAGEIATGFTVTNTYEPPQTTTIEGSKTWNDNNNQDGKRPKSITIKLMNGDIVVESKEVRDVNGEWKWSFTNKPKYENGQVINYTIQEEAVDGYTTTYDGYNITNTHTPETTSISGTKTWNDNNDQDGKRPKSITIKLMNGDTVVESKEVRDVNGEWKWTFADKPKYENGQAINYTIQEVEVEGYSTKVEGYNITNTYTPETVNIEGSKTWVDNNNQDKIRPTSITIKLLKNSKEFKTKEVTEENGQWKWAFTDLPRYENGAEIKYTIDEVDVKDYKKVVNGYNVTNTHIPWIPLTPATTNVKVTKVWSEENHKAEITVKLIKNGEETEKNVVLNEGNNWTNTFENLPVFDEVNSENANVYTVKEVGEKDGVIKLGADKFTVKITGNAKEGFTVTNTYVAPIPQNPIPNNSISNEPNKPKNSQKIVDKKEYKTKKEETKLPKTGDSSDLTFYGMMLLMSGLVLLSINDKNSTKY